MNYKVISASIKKTIISRKTKTIIAALLLAANSAFAQAPSYVPTNGLVGWWPFNGNANDESGNGNNGTVNGATLSQDRFGINSKSYYLNGQTDYLSVPVISNLLTPSKISISLWCKIPINYTANNPIGMMIRSRFYGYIMLYDSLSKKIRFETFSNGTASPSVSQSISSNYNDGNWHHLVGTFDGTFNKLYIDGQLITSSTSTSANITYASDGIIAFGRDGNNPSPLTALYQGNLDDIGIWNRALTQQEITALYNSQLCTSNTITADGPTNFCAGNYVNLTSDVVGGTYQWKKNGVNITTNGTSRTYKATATGSYTCVATCNGTALTSNAISVTSKTNAFASVSASGATSFCAGDSVTLNCTNLGSNYSVQWYRTNISMENATAYSQVVKQPGTYKVVTKNLTTGCSRISGSSVVVAVNCRLAGDITSAENNPLNANEARLMDNELSQGVHIFPNPNNGLFTFSYDGEEYGDAVLQVINNMGQMIYNSNVNITEGGYTQELQLGDAASKGIYIVRLLINGNSYDSRVLVR